MLFRSFTDSLEAAVAESECVLFAVPSSAFRSVATQAKRLIKCDTLLLSATKGLENTTGFRMTQILDEIFPAHRASVAALSGPNLAIEIAQGVPAGAVVASTASSTAIAVQQLFKGIECPLFRVYTSRDVIGVELGGAIKNIDRKSVV